ncbi:hypothetical protein ACX93W_04320 [Paenibacillus sp. CAU 1782]
MAYWTKSVFSDLPAAAKDAWLKELVQALPGGFSYKGLASFERFGTALETGVYLYGDREFVYVPGDAVTLGWEDWQEGMDEDTEEEFRATLDEYDVEDGTAFLKSMMSPVRKADIPPMLVERYARGIGWIEVAEQDEEAYDYEDFHEELEKFKTSGYNEYTCYNSFKFVREQDAVRCYLFDEELTYGGLVEELSSEGFSLPNEDQWEYLYGGGCRTLFPWGDSFDYSLRVKYFGDEDGADSAGKEKGYDLEKPNGFGLCFAGDPYQYELISGETSFLLKGGDGGGMVCGGTGLLMGYLPAVAPYYRDPYGQELEWEDLFDHMNIRRIIVLK